MAPGIAFALLIVLIGIGLTWIARIEREHLETQTSTHSSPAAATAPPAETKQSLAS